MQGRQPLPITMVSGMMLQVLVCLPAKTLPAILFF